MKNKITVRDNKKELAELIVYYFKELDLPFALYIDKYYIPSFYELSKPKDDWYMDIMVFSAWPFEDITIGNWDYQLTDNGSSFESAWIWNESQEFKDLIINRFIELLPDKITLNDEDIYLTYEDDPIYEHKI